MALATIFSQSQYQIWFNLANLVQFGKFQLPLSTVLLKVQENGLRSACRIQASDKPAQKS